MKQTAVQQLIDIFNQDQVSFTDWFLDNYKSFLEIERQQIADAYINGLCEYPVPFFTYYQAEQYYNETFKDSPLK